MFKFILHRPDGKQATWGRGNREIHCLDMSEFSTKDAIDWISAVRAKEISGQLQCVVVIGASSTKEADEVALLEQLSPLGAIYVERPKDCDEIHQVLNYLERELKGIYKGFVPDKMGTSLEISASDLFLYENPPFKLDAKSRARLNRYLASETDEEESD